MDQLRLLKVKPLRANPPNANCPDTSGWESRACPDLSGSLPGLLFNSEIKMGQVKSKVKISNQRDLELLEEGQISPEEVRQIEIEGVVDTGAMSLCLPISIIKRLGLRQVDERVVRTANGVVSRRVFANAWVTILGRSHPFGVVELPDDCPALIGVVVLEELDLAPNPAKETLEFNPEHGDQWTTYIY